MSLEVPPSASSQPGASRQTAYVPAQTPRTPHSQYVVASWDPDTPPAAGDLMEYDATTGMWVPVALEDLVLPSGVGAWQNLLELNASLEKVAGGFAQVRTENFGYSMRFRGAVKSTAEIASNAVLFELPIGVYTSQYEEITAFPITVASAANDEYGSLEVTLNAEGESEEDKAVKVRSAHIIKSGTTIQIAAVTFWSK